MTLSSVVELSLSPDPPPEGPRPQVLPSSTDLTFDWKSRSLLKPGSASRMMHSIEAPWDSGGDTSGDAEENFIDLHLLLAMPRRLDTHHSDPAALTPSAVASTMEDNIPELRGNPSYTVSGQIGEARGHFDDGTIVEVMDDHEQFQCCEVLYQRQDMRYIVKRLHTGEIVDVDGFKMRNPFRVQDEVEVRDEQGKWRLAEVNSVGSSGSSMLYTVLLLESNEEVIVEGCQTRRQLFFNYVFAAKDASAASQTSLTSLAASTPSAINGMMHQGKLQLMLIIGRTKDYGGYECIPIEAVMGIDDDDDDDDVFDFTIRHPGEVLPVADFLLALYVEGKATIGTLLDSIQLISPLGLINDSVGSIMAALTGREEIDKKTRKNRELKSLRTKQTQRAREERVALEIANIFNWQILHHEDELGLKEDQGVLDAAKVVSPITRRTDAQRAKIRWKKERQAAARAATSTIAGLSGIGDVAGQAGCQDAGPDPELDKNREIYRCCRWSHKCRPSSRVNQIPKLANLIIIRQSRLRNRESTAAALLLKRLKEGGLDKPGTACDSTASKSDVGTDSTSQASVAMPQPALASSAPIIDESSSLKVLPPCILQLFHPAKLPFRFFRRLKKKSYIAGTNPRGGAKVQLEYIKQKIRDWEQQQHRTEKKKIVLLKQYLTCFTGYNGYPETIMGLKRLFAENKLDDDLMIRLTCKPNAKSKISLSARRRKSAACCSIGTSCPTSADSTIMPAACYSKSNEDGDVVCVLKCFSQHFNRSASSILADLKNKFSSCSDDEKIKLARYVLPRSNNCSSSTLIEYINRLISTMLEGSSEYYSKGQIFLLCWLLEVNLECIYFDYGGSQSRFRFDFDKFRGGGGNVYPVVAFHLNPLKSHLSVEREKGVGCKCGTHFSSSTINHIDAMVEDEEWFIGASGRRKLRALSFLDLGIIASSSSSSSSSSGAAKKNLFQAMFESHCIRGKYTNADAFKAAVLDHYNKGSKVGQILLERRLLTNSKTATFRFLDIGVASNVGEYITYHSNSSYQGGVIDLFVIASLLDASIELQTVSGEITTTYDVIQSDGSILSEASEIPPTLIKICFSESTGFSIT